MLNVTYLNMTVVLPKLVEPVTLRKSGGEKIKIPIKCTANTKWS